MGELAEQHGYELVPASEAFAVLIGLVFARDFVEDVAREKCQYLAEQTGAGCHGYLRCRDGEGLWFYPYTMFLRPEFNNLFWTGVIPDI